jgi:hypothetical protein
MSNETKIPANGKPDADSKTRTGGYPTVSLQKAVSLMQKVWEKEKRNAAPATALLQHWNYAAKSSGGFQAIASLRRFGLLEAVPGAEPRALKVSQAAMDLLRYENTDQAAYRKQLKFFALLPEMYEALWTKYGDELPSDKTIETHLVFDRHFSEESAQQLIKLYKETISFAQLVKGDTVEESERPIKEKPSETLVAQDRPQTAARPIDANNVETLISSSELPIPIAGKVARIPFPMSEDDFDLFIGTLQLWKKTIVRKLASIPPEIKLPANAMWQNNDTDKPVRIVSVMGERDGTLFYRSEDGTGIPASQLKFC